MLIRAPSPAAGGWDGVSETSLETQAHIRVDVAFWESETNTSRWST